MPDVQAALFAQAAAYARERLLTDTPPLPDIVCVHGVRPELNCWKCVENWKHKRERKI